MQNAIPIGKYSDLADSAPIMIKVASFKRGVRPVDCGIPTAEICQLKKI
jgi:hypothetical protein